MISANFSRVKYLFLKAFFHFEMDYGTEAGIVLRMSLSFVCVLAAVVVDANPPQQMLCYFSCFGC